MAIAFGNSADLGSNFATTSNFTAAYTIGGGANRLLILGITGDTCDTSPVDPTVTYGGTTMLKAVRNDDSGNGSMRYDYIYYLLEGSLPAAGAHNFVVTFPGVQFIIVATTEYTGVSAFDGSTAVNSQAPDNASTLSTSITTNANGCWAILMEQHDQTASVTTAGSGAVLRVIAADFNQPTLLDSGAPISPAGSYNMTTNASSPLTSISQTIAAFTAAAAAPTAGVGIVPYNTIWWDSA